MSKFNIFEFKFGKETPPLKELIKDGSNYSFITRYNFINSWS
jgi:hypothetical protein